MVDHGVFTPELALPAADADVVLGEEAALVLGEEAAGLVRGGKALVRAAQHEEAPDAAAAHAVKVAGGHAVEGDGDDADVIAREHGAQQLLEGAGVHGHVAENLGRLPDGLRADVPELEILRTQLELSLAAEALNALLQLVLQAAFVHIVGQGLGLLTAGRGLVFHALAEAEKRACDFSAGSLGQREPLAHLVGPFLPVAVRMAAKGLALQPGGGGGLPFEQVVAEGVAALVREAGEAAAQKGDQVFGVKAAEDDLVEEVDPEREGLFGHGVAVREEERDAVAAEAAFQQAAVILEAAHRHGDVAPAAAVPADGVQDRGRGQFALDAGVLGAQEADLPVRTVGRVGRIVEHMLGEEAQGAAVLLLPYGQDLDRDTALFGIGAEALAREVRGQEVFLTVQALGAGQADGEVGPLLEHGAEHGVLEAGEVDEAVDIDAVKLTEAEGADLARQDLQRVLGRRAGARRDGIPGLADQGQLAELFPQVAVKKRGRLAQADGIGRGGVQVVQLLQQEGLEVDVLGGTFIEVQQGADLVQGHRHAEKPARLVHAALCHAAVQRHAEAGKAREAHHLGKTGKTVAAGSTKLALGFVAVLLGDQQQNPAAGPFDRLSDFVDDEGGFAAADPADEKSHSAARQAAVRAATAALLRTSWMLLSRLSPPVSSTTLARR